MRSSESRVLRTVSLAALAVVSGGLLALSLQPLAVNAAVTLGAQWLAALAVGITTVLIVDLATEPAMDAQAVRVRGPLRSPAAQPHHLHFTTRRRMEI
jgi:hypothetical protein